MGSLIGLLVLSGPFAFIKVSTVTAQNNELRKQQQGYEEKLDKAQTGLLSYNPSLGLYLNDFLNLFINRTGKTDDYQKWGQSLRPYFAKDLEPEKLTTAENWQEQKLEASELVALYVQDDVKIAQMKTKLTVQTGEKEVEKGKGKDKKKTKEPVHETQTVYLNIPYASKNNQYTIIAFPFVTPEQSAVGSISDGLKRNSNDQSELETTDTDAVTSFAKKFLDKDVSSPAKEMEFVMNNPVGLNGAYKAQEITDIHASGTHDKPRISGIVQMEDTKTGAIHAEQFDLSLKKQDGTYFVLNFTH